MKRKEQELKELRREIEVLRAQVKSLGNKNSEFTMLGSNAVSSAQQHKNINIEYNSQNLDILLDNKYIKTQLTKTFVFSVLAFAIIAGFYFYGFDNVIRMLNIQI